jgi:hypothetical protein
MSIYVSTTNATSYSPQSSIFGLGAASAPTAFQQPAANKQSDYSTVAALLTLASILGGTELTTQALPPTFADTARITSPSRPPERKDSALSGYKISQSQSFSVNEYLRQHITSRDFLRDVAVIIDNIYGSKIIRNIHVVEDVDTGKPIMELTVLSGLPLNDEFDQKDQLLFQKIEAAGLAWGLRDVVISQG